jgi:hypothetical protein
MISLRTTGFSFLTVLAIAGAARAAIDDGLVSYWPFNATLQDVLAVNNGTLVGTNTTPSYTPGKFGQGIDLDGVDQYVDVGNSPTLDMDVNGAGLKTGHVSISAWFRVDGFGKDWQALVAKGEGSAFRVARRGGEQGIAYAGGSGEGPGLSPDVSDGAFHHMVAITEHQVSTRLWVDGMLVSTGGAPTIVNDGNMNARNPTNQPLYIGDNPQTGNRTWNGLIDDVAIWNRPLTDGEIASLWNNGTGNSLGALIDPNTAPVPGDVNGDRTVNNADFDIIRGNFLLSATTVAEGDLNRDGLVEFADFRIWKNNAPAGAGSAASIPEPGTLVLVKCALLVWVGRLSRRYRARAVEPVAALSIGTTLNNNNGRSLGGTFSPRILNLNGTLEATSPNSTVSVGNGRLAVNGGSTIY